MPASPTLTPHAFVTKWRNDTRKERSVSQEHFIDLCRLIGHETPGENRDGSLVFEAGADKLSGGQGWADVWKKGVFGWEYKGPRADLNKAYVQLQQYRDSLQNPPLLVVSDIQTIVIHTNFVNTVKQTYTLTLDDLLTPGKLQTLRDVFTNHEAFRPTLTSQQVTEAAAAEFGRLATLLQRYGEAPQTIAHFLIRLLFCLFAEDAGLLPNGLFTRIISQTRHRAPAFVAQMKDLFHKMSTGGFFGTDEIKHFNGSLFENDHVLELDSDGMAILERVSKLDWSAIEPSIFGTLFERSLDPAKRSQLGAHYTSRDDIMLIVEPVLMAPLRRQWVAVQEQARALAVQRDLAGGTRRNRLDSELSRLLSGFVDTIVDTKVLDPACGSGNFLYVALKQLLDLEKEVINLRGDLGLTTMFPMVGPEQLYGIELNEYAHELAPITVWIGYLQWLRDNGFGEPSEPILQSLKTIKHMDAILAFDSEGKPYEPEWPDADVVIGNPPFLGDKKMRGELGRHYVTAIQQVYANQLPGQSDIVCYWFEKTRALIEAQRITRAGLLATQGIRGGANRTVLERIKNTGDIFFAWSDRNWILDGANVHVSLVGFDNGAESVRTLNGNTVQTINADLTSDVNLTLAQQLRENLQISFQGVTLLGPFDIDKAIALDMLRLSENPNGRPNDDVLRKWVNAKDIVDISKSKWIIDFGVNMSEADAAQYLAPFAYVTQNVKPFRDKAKSSERSGNWWIHLWPRHLLRKGILSKRRYIVTPRVAKHCIFVWLSADTLPSDALVAFVRDDDLFFGLLQSHPHELWSRRKGTQLRESDSGRRYTPKSTFETFPFPWSPGREPQDDSHVFAISEAAQRLVDLRDAWLNSPGLSENELKKRTLTNLYNARPEWLAEAHAQLDAAVCDAYGWPHDLTDEQILERLLALNLERAAKGGVVDQEIPSSDATDDDHAE